MSEEMDKKELIYNYLKSGKYIALATSTRDGKPQAATVGYVLDDDDLLINTYTYYRKYENLISNPHIVCVLTDDHEMTLQFDGKVKQLEGNDADDAKRKMLEFEPDYAEYLNNEATRFFRITPAWMRLRDYTKTPVQVTEYTPG